MVVGRNEPCPCGSGKKYKKCCLNQEVVIELQEHFLEQFYRDKEGIVNKLIDYIAKNTTYSKYQRLKSTFMKEVEGSIHEDLQNEYFNFWIYFFHRFENGMRGIEWYFSENKHRLDGGEKTMTERWTTLTPRLLQAVDKTNEVIIFEDVYTKERFNVASDEENLPHFLPWMGTFALLEPFQDKYYFNGVRVLVGPEEVRRAEVKLTQLMEETNRSYERVTIEYYLDILKAMLTDESEKHGEDVENELSEYTLTYEIIDDVIVLEYLRSHPELQIDTWKKEEKTLSWLDNWQAYQDSELDSVIKLADVNGIIEIKGKQLQFKNYDGEKTEEMKVMLDKLKNMLLFVEEHVNTVSGLGIQPKNYAVSMEKDTPQYFALYAQNKLVHELDEPLPMFNNATLRQLADERPEDANTLLKQSEYNMYETIVQQIGRVEVTADFNTVRKKLGLPLSQFVTGGEERKTGYYATESEVTSSITEDDIPYLEQLGFTPGTVDNFYSIDIVRFYKEKTNDKSKATEQKYRNSLYELREILEQADVTSWEECDITFWKKIITEEAKQGEDVYSEAEWNDFLHTIKALLIWLENIEKITHSGETVAFIKGFAT